MTDALGQSDVAGAANAFAQAAVSAAELDATCPAEMSVFRDMHAAWLAQQPS
jgi:hypothetical protein